VDNIILQNIKRPRSIKTNIHLHNVYEENDGALQLLLPSGHMKSNIVKLMMASGYKVCERERNYKPTIEYINGVDRIKFHVRFMKPQNIALLLSENKGDLGFTGADWTEELELTTHCKELLDTKLDKVSIVVAKPEQGICINENTNITVATEYLNIAKKWMNDNNLNGRVIKSYGSTESFPPEFADCIIDNMASGSTIRANGLIISETILESSTRLYAAPQTSFNSTKRALILRFLECLQKGLCNSNC